jgi:hypothetical protein
MTKANQNKLMRLVIMIANRRGVFEKMSQQREFVEAAILIYPLLRDLEKDKLALIKQEFIQRGEV